MDDMEYRCKVKLIWFVQLIFHFRQKLDGLKGGHIVHVCLFDNSLEFLEFLLILCTIIFHLKEGSCGIEGQSSAFFCLF